MLVTDMTKAATQVLAQLQRLRNWLPRADDPSEWVATHRWMETLDAITSEVRGFVDEIDRLRAEVERQKEQLAAEWERAERAETALRGLSRKTLECMSLDEFLRVEHALSDSAQGGERCSDCGKMVADLATHDCDDTPPEPDGRFEIVDHWYDADMPSVDEIVVVLREAREHSEIQTDDLAVRIDALLEKLEE